LKGRRVVITGLGIISPVGNSVEESWRNILAGQSGVRLIEAFDTAAYSTRFAAYIPNFDLAEFDIPHNTARKMDPFVQYALAAAVQAIRDAGLTKNPSNADKIGVSIGSGIGGLSFIEKNHQTLLDSGPRRVSPFFIPGAIINIAAGYVSILYGFKGPNLAYVTACSTGAHSIGMAARHIAYGDADIMVAGGSEYATTPLGVAGFAAVRALSTRNDDPAGASRPWDIERDGFVLGDGAGIVVLEEYEHAKKRGANIYAEFLGIGMSGDAHHITQPAEGGTGGAAAIHSALQDAHINVTDVDYINAHGTSTLVGDVGETLGIKLAFGDHAKSIAVSSTKSMTGHLLGAAGAVETIFSVLALRDQIAPPTINLHNPSPDCDLDYVPLQPREMKINVCLSNSFGFGGTNVTLALGRV